MDGTLCYVVFRNVGYGDRSARVVSRFQNNLPYAMKLLKDLSDLMEGDVGAHQP